MTTETDWISVVLSGSSLAVSIWAAIYASKSDQKSTALTERQNELSEMQTKLSKISWSDEYFRELNQWASQVAFLISEAIHAAEDPGAQTEKIREVRSKLSASIDTGRFYFLNKYEEEYGKEKPFAYRGFRQDVIDYIVFAYDEISKKDGKIDRDQLVQYQRLFVSEVQKRLDPKSREAKILEVLKEFSSVAIGNKK